ncbi:MAG: GNAT family N-acetyltransferase [Flavobacteriales bacterium]|nr:GNAT family N-acetyltransferase [Flavobacteriales bacterium]
MKNIITTDRLDLREFSLEEAPLMVDLNADPEVMKYTGDVAFSSVEDAENLIRNYDQYKRFGFGRWSVYLKESGEFIGWCGLKQHEDGMIDLGYRFFQNQWGKGYATESSIACIDYGFNQLKMEEIVGRTAKANIPSIRVLEKAGMVFWKEAPCEGIENSVYYKIVNPNS